MARICCANCPPPRIVCLSADAERPAFDSSVAIVTRAISRFSKQRHSKTTAESTFQVNCLFWMSRDCHAKESSSATVGANCRTAVSRQMLLDFVKKPRQDRGRCNSSSRSQRCPRRLESAWPEGNLQLFVSLTIGRNATAIYRRVRSAGTRIDRKTRPTVRAVTLADYNAKAGEWNGRTNVSRLGGRQKMGLAPSRVTQILTKTAIARCLSHFFSTLLGLSRHACPKPHSNLEVSCDESPESNPIGCPRLVSRRTDGIEHRSRYGTKRVG